MINKIKFYCFFFLFNFTVTANAQIKATYYLDSNAVEYDIHCTDSVDRYLPLIIKNKQTVILSLDAIIEVEIDSLDYYFEGITIESYQKLHSVLRGIYIENVDTLIINTVHWDSFHLVLDNILYNLAEVKFLNIFLYCGDYVSINKIDSTMIRKISVSELSINTCGYTIFLPSLDMLGVKKFYINNNDDGEIKKIIGKSKSIEKVYSSDKKRIKKKQFKNVDKMESLTVDISFPSYSKSYIKTGWPNIGGGRNR
jgi:hypothetical protein